MVAMRLWKVPIWIPFFPKMGSTKTACSGIIKIIKFPDRYPLLVFGGFFSGDLARRGYHQKFQVPKIKVLNLIFPYFGGGLVFPYISLTTYSLKKGEDSSILGT